MFKVFTLHGAVSRFGHDFGIRILDLVVLVFQKISLHFVFLGQKLYTNRVLYSIESTESWFLCQKSNSNAYPTEKLVFDFVPVHFFKCLVFLDSPRINIFYSV